MEKIMRPVWTEIDLDILANNMKNIKKLAGNKEVMAVVKADAYGHGTKKLCPYLNRYGIKDFVVAGSDKALELRRNGIIGSILVLEKSGLNAIFR